MGVAVDTHFVGDPLEKGSNKKKRPTDRSHRIQTASRSFAII